MGDYLISVAGTAQGARLAMALALTSAVAHALFGALQKGRHDPWLSRGAIDLWLLILSLPLALWAVPTPEGRMWWILAGAAGLHFAYKLTIALSYERTDYTVAYPVMRGTGPLLIAGAAVILFDETMAPVQWLGVAALSGGILALAGLNIWRADPAARRRLTHGLGWAFAAGGMVALYTTFDAWGIRQAGDPLTFLAWFFLLSAVDFSILLPVILWRQNERPAVGPLLTRGVVGALVAYVSFGAVMVATRIGSVSQSAVLRETSTVFAALIGWLLLGERPGPTRAALMVVIAGGALLVQLG